MSEIVRVSDATIIAAEINVIKERTKQAVLSASIEIGQRLCEAKELVPFGDWEQWLHDKVDYSQSTANNLMRIFKEYGDDQLSLGGTSKSQTFANLSYSQALALFALPAEEREDFVKENPVEDMSARQLQDAIAAQKAAEVQKTAAENKLQGTQKLLDIANESKDKLEAALKKSDDDRAGAEQQAAAEIKKLKEELAAASEPVAPSAAELKKLRGEVKAKIEADYKKKEDQLTLEKKTAEEKTQEIQKSYEDQLKKLKLDNESIAAQAADAEKKLSLSDPEAQKFAVYFDTFQQTFQQLRRSLDKLAASGNTETAGKLRGALKQIIAQLTQTLE